MLSFFTNSIFSKSLDEYSYLYENKVTSEHYEIIKLIDGEIDALLVDEESGMSIVVAGRYLWKISQEGYVVDTLHSSVGLYRSGLIFNNKYRPEGDPFHKKTFIDWIYTGNRFDQEFPEVKHLDALADSELFKYIEQSQQAEFFTTTEGDHEYGMVLLKRSDQWQTLDISDYTQFIDDSCHRYQRRAKDIWVVTCFEGVNKKQLRQLQTLSNLLPFQPDFKSGKEILTIEKFVKGLHYFDEGFGGWVLGNVLGKTLYRDYPGERPQRYWYGDGYFNLSHFGEVLKFKAMVSDRTDYIDFDHISIYDLSNRSGKHTRLIDIAHIGAAHNYLDKEDELEKYQGIEAGLYVVREKINRKAPADIIVGDYSSYKSEVSWQPVVIGMSSYSSVFGGIVFFNPEISPRHYLLNDIALEDTLSDIPKSLFINWAPRKKSSVFKLNLTNNESVFLTWRADNNAWPIEIMFDEDEIVTAFKALTQPGLQLELEFSINELSSISANLSIRLKNTQQSIQLKKTTYNYTKTDKSVSDLYTEKALKLKKYLHYKMLEKERAKLEVVFKQVIAGSGSVENYMEEASLLTKRSRHKADQAYYFANYTTKLLIKLINQKKYTLANRVIIQYAEDIYPVVGRHDKTQDVASMALVLGIIIKNNGVSELVFKRLLAKNFDVTHIQNKILLYNLSCYYALKKDKPALLASTKQALKQGKQAESFLNDEDFKFYWKDKDFLNIFKSKNKY